MGVSKIVLTSVIVVVASTLCASVASAQRLAVVRVGDGSAPLTSASTAVFIDVFQNGTLATTVPLPTTIAPLTMSGVANSEGALRLSTNGRYLTLAGYGAAPGMAAIAASTSAVVPRVVARVDGNGVVDTTTRFTDTSYSGNNIRGAVSDDGTRFWTAGTAAAGADAGIRFVVFGPGATGLPLATAPTNTRVPGIFAGQLFFTSATGAFQGLSSVGTGLPPVAPPATPPVVSTVRPGFPTASGPSPYSFVAFDLNASVGDIAGLDTVYVADDRAPPAGGLQKWTFDGTTWALTAFAPTGSIVGVRGLTGRVVSGTTVALYATTAEAVSNTLVTVTDDGTTPTPAFTVLATAPANTVFHGVDFAPPLVSTPVPATTPLARGTLAGLLILAGAFWIAGARRLRKSQWIRAQP
jgi:hypothetical protein